MLSLFGTGRDIYVERYFTSHGLVCNLLQQNLTLIGIVMANRREVLSQFKAAKGREVKSTKVLYDHSNKILLLSCVHKRNKNALMMSSSHFSILIINYHKNLTVITDYDKHKRGVDTLDENCEEFSCLRKTNLWAIVINYILISFATNNAFIVMRGSGKCDRKTDFLKQLSFQLAQSYLSNQKFRSETKILSEKMGLIDAASNTINRTVQGIKRRRCTDVGCILALHAWLAADVFARNKEKYQKTHIA